MSQIKSPQYQREMGRKSLSLVQRLCLLNISFSLPKHLHTSEAFQFQVLIHPIVAELIEDPNQVNIQSIATTGYTSTGRPYLYTKNDRIFGLFRFHQQRFYIQWWLELLSNSGVPL